MKVTKSFATILRNNQSVNTIAQNFNAVKKGMSVQPDTQTTLKSESVTSPKSTDKKLPENFSPFDKWVNYLTPIHNQGACGDCYSTATTGALADRFSLLTLGSCRPILSSDQPTICNGVIGSKIVVTDDTNINAHTEK